MTDIKVTIVDDEKLFVSGLKLILNMEEDISIVASASNGKELLSIIKNPTFETDVILLDLSMPIMDGIDTLIELNRLGYTKEKIVILSSHYNDGIILRMLDEGASGFLAKNENPAVVIQTVKEVYQKGFSINDQVLQLIRERRLISKRKPYTEQLTSREIEVVTLICQEYTTKEIAEKLFISPRTVEGHRNRILEKIDCKNIAGVIIYAIEHNLFKINVSKYQ